MKGGRSVFTKKLWDSKLVGERVPMGLAWGGGSMNVFWAFFING